MLPDRLSNPRPLTYESGALPIALRGPFHCANGKLVSFMQMVAFLKTKNKFLPQCHHIRPFRGWELLLSYKTFRKITRNCKPL